ncbi:AAA family ATPase [Desemzia sp. FAM 23990]|uniref:AAA family ATPase n=1 Tax=Desemzia sp. FAM 23990 TaxID=3259520 RepID=UPI003888CCC6
MKQIKLKKMSIRNFKGFQRLDIGFGGSDTQIYGDNATGKTSIFDAFTFCLFGKDSHDSTDFAWKPLDKSNKQINHLETEVELVLDEDGKELTLSRMTAEKWTKKRGVNTETFQGHETTYRIDGVQTTQKKFKERIDQFISEDLFKQLTNVYYVAETMKAKDRREMLFNLVGDFTDEEVIKSEKELKPLLKILNGHSVDDKRSLIIEERRKINKDLDSIPNRIDEVDRSIPDLSSFDKESLQQEIDEIDKKNEKLEEKVSGIRNGNAATDLRAEINTKKSELELAISKYQVEQYAKVEGLQKEQQQLYDEAMGRNQVVGEIESSLRADENAVIEETSLVEEVKRKQAALRTEFLTVRDDIFPSFDEHKTSCQFCGQDYPLEKQQEIKATYEEERKAFNIKKAAKLENINSQGVDLNLQVSLANERIASLEENARATKKALELAIKARDEVKAKHESVKAEIKEIQAKQDPFEATDAYSAIIDDLNQLNEKLDNISKSSEQELEKYRIDISNQKNKRYVIEDQLYQFKLAANQEKRKQELIDQEKTLSIRFGELEDQLYLLDQFTRAKVNLLTERINSQFKFVHFKLFEEQINGGLKEVCEPTVNGVPYSSGLNSAARINAGIDIINAISRLEGVTVPLFIDNSESVTQLLDTEAQTVQMYVAEGVDKLKIETKITEGVV